VQTAAGKKIRRLVLETVVANRQANAGLQHLDEIKREITATEETDL
jgi:hypothetical protein